jgi:hypothetical protein
MDQLVRQEARRGRLAAGNAVDERDRVRAVAIAARHREPRLDEHDRETGDPRIPEPRAGGAYEAPEVADQILGVEGPFAEDAELDQYSACRDTVTLDVARQDVRLE